MRNFYARSSEVPRARLMQIWSSNKDVATPYNTRVLADTRVTVVFISFRLRQLQAFVIYEISAT